MIYCTYTFWFAIILFLELLLQNLIFFYYLNLRTLFLLFVSHLFLLNLLKVFIIIYRDNLISIYVDILLIIKILYSSTWSITIQLWVLIIIIELAEFNWLGVLKIIYFQYLIFICFGYWNQCVLGCVVLEQWTDSRLLSIFLHVQSPDMRNLIINCLWVLFLVEQNIFVGYICLLGVAIFLLQTT